METSTLVEPVKPVLSVVKNGLMWISEFLSKYFPFEANNIFWFIIVVGSLYISKKVISMIPRVEKSLIVWILLAGLIIFAFTIN